MSELSALTEVYAFGNVTIYRGTIGSGGVLEVVLVTYPKTYTNAVVTRSVHAGSSHEIPGQSGLAHFFEHIVFKGTKTYDGNNGVWYALGNRGATMNAQTWSDGTQFYTDLPSEHIDLALNVEFDRMTQLLLNEDDVKSEIAVVRNEKEIGQNSDFRMCLQTIFSLMFTEHPYGHTTIGNARDIENINTKTLRDFMSRNYYHGIQVSVVGYIPDPQAVLQKIQATFLTDMVVPPEAALRPVIHTEEPRQRGLRQSTVHLACNDYLVSVSHRVPRAVHIDSAAVSFLPDFLSNSMSAVLNILVQKGMCAEVSTLIDTRRNGGALVTVARIPPALITPQKSVEQHLAEVLFVIVQVYDIISSEPTNEFRGCGAISQDRFFKRPEMQSVLDTARTTKLREFERMKSVPQELAENLGIAFVNGDTLSPFINAELVSQVTLDDLDRVAREYCKEINRTIVTIVPKSVDTLLPKNIHSFDEAVVTYASILGDKYATVIKNTMDREIASHKNRVELAGLNVVKDSESGVTIPKALLPISSDQRRTNISYTLRCKIPLTKLAEMIKSALPKEEANVAVAGMIQEYKDAYSEVGETDEHSITTSVVKYLHLHYDIPIYAALSGTDNVYEIHIKLYDTDWFRDPGSFDTSRDLYLHTILPELVAMLINNGNSNYTPAKIEEMNSLYATTVTVSHSISAGFTYMLRGKLRAEDGTSILQLGIEMLYSFIEKQTFNEIDFLNIQNRMRQNISQRDQSDNLEAHADAIATSSLYPPKSHEAFGSDTNAYLEALNQLTFPMVQKYYNDMFACTTASVLVASPEPNMSSESGIVNMLIVQVLEPWFESDAADGRAARRWLGAFLSNKNKPLGKYIELKKPTEQVVDAKTIPGYRGDHPYISINKLYKHYEPVVISDRHLVVTVDGNLPFNTSIFYALAYKDNSIVKICRATSVLNDPTSLKYTALQMAVMLANRFSGRLMQWVRDVNGLAYTVYIGETAATTQTPAYVTIRAQSMCNPNNAARTVTEMLRAFAWLALYGPQRAKVSQDIAGPPENGETVSKISNWLHDKTPELEILQVAMALYERIDGKWSSVPDDQWYETKDGVERVHPRYRYQVLYATPSMYEHITGLIMNSPENQLETNKISAVSTFIDEKLRLAVIPTYGDRLPLRRLMVALQQMVFDSRSELGLLKYTRIKNLEQGTWRCSTTINDLEYCVNTDMRVRSFEPGRTRTVPDEKFMHARDKQYELIESLTERDVRRMCSYLFDLHRSKPVEYKDEEKLAVDNNSIVVVCTSPPHTKPSAFPRFISNAATANDAELKKADDDFVLEIADAFKYKPTPDDMKKVLDTYEKKRRYKFKTPTHLYISY